MPQKKRIADNSGSTLLVVVVFAALLTMIGTALLVSTAAHLKAQKVQEDRKFAFYSAEAGIDEVIARLSEQIQKEHIDATGKAREEMEKKLAEQSLLYEKWLSRQREIAGEAPDAGNISGDITLPEDFPLYNHDGTINQDKAREFAESEYKEAFKTKFEEYVKENFVFAAGDISTLEAKWNEDISNPATSKIIWGSALKLSKEKTYDTGVEDIVVKVGIHGEEENIAFDGSNLLNLPIFSIYNPTDSSRKLITVNIIISVPNYGMPVIVDQNVMKFEPNILWTKALTAGGNIIADGGATAVYGNIYAGGDITVGGVSSSDLTLRGEAVAGGNITFGASNSRLTINGNAYAGNIIVGEHIEDNPDWSNSIVSTIRNCELSVNINGGESAYTSYSINAGGVLGGRSSLGDAVTKGSLAILGSNSKVKIDGNYTGFLPFDNYNTFPSRIIIDTPELEPESVESASVETNLTIDGEATICGNAYLKFPNSSDVFTTGESVVLRNNFMGYSNWLAGAYLSNFESSFASNHSPYIPDGSGFLYHNVSGIFAPYRYGGIELDGFDKADYFYQIGIMESDSNFLAGEGMSPYINKGSGLINLNGAYYGNGAGVSNGNMLARTPGGDYEIMKRQSSAEIMFYRQINAFGDLAVNGGVLDFYVENNAMSIADLFTFSSSYNISSEVNGYKETVIVNADGGDISLSDEYIKGVIVTRGNVTVRPSVKEFRGTIIAGGNIIIGGNTEIINDRDFIAKALACYNGSGALRGESAGFASSETILPAYALFTPAEGNYITKEDYVYVHDKDIDIGDKYNTISGLVNTLNWKIIEY